MAFTLGYVVNEGTDYEFTVSNETIQEAVQATGGITEADIADYCYTALVDSRIETVKAESHTDVQQPGWASWCQEHAMFYYVNNTRYINSNVGINNTSDKVYERNFLIWYGTIYPGEPEEKTGWFLIMDIKDIKKYYVNFSNAGFGQTTVESTRTDSGVTTPFTGYSGDAYTYNSSLANVYPDIYTDDDQITTIRVINVLNINNELWIGRLNPSNYGEANTAYSTYGYAMYIDYKLTGWLSASDNEHLFQKGTINWVGIPKIIDMDYPDLGFDVSPVIRTYAESTDDMILDISAEHYGGFPVVTSAVPACKTLNGILKWMSWCGLLFKYGGITYKPIIESGVIVGFSSNMFAPSEFDTMTNVTGNNISPTPPGPTPPSADTDDMDLTEIGFLSDIGGAGLYWLFPSPPTGMFHDFNLNAPEGSMISQNVLSCYISALNWSWQTVNQKMVIYSNGSKKPAYESTDAYPLIYQSNPHTIAGYYEVPRQTNTFYDFSPYTIYELYIPFCGWIGLPDTVAGRAIRVYMDFDASTCTCKAIVMLESEGGETIIGEITGNFGAPCPIQVVEGGLYKQAAINSGLQVATGTAMAIYGVASGAGALAINGLGNAAQGISSCNSVGNANYGQTIGRAGDTSNLCGGHYCKIRITHPVIDKVIESTTFAHTVGYLCNMVGTLNNFHGFTICLNPHIIGIDCTDEEKEEIKRLLEDGVIL